MLKRIIALVTVISLVALFVGCGKKADQDAQAPEETDTLIPDEEPEVPQEEEPAAEEDQQELVENQYKDLDITVGITDPSTVQPGHPFAVEVALTNLGEDTLDFVKGSGSAVFPSAIEFSSDDFVVVPPREHLGPMTMDYRMETLEPGETKEYTYTFMAIQPVDSIQDIIFELMQEDVYMGDVTLEDIAEEYPELEATPSGSYQALIRFSYALLEDGESNPTGNPTGYQELVVNIDVV